MDAVILAGGYGTRMWPVTNTLPKMLFPLGNGTVLDRLLTDLGANERIEQIYLSTNRRFATQFETAVAGRDETVTVSVEETNSDADKHGAIGGLHALYTRENLSDELLVVAGDNVFGFDLGTFVDAFANRQSSVIATHDVGSLERARNYGVVETKDDCIVSFHEKPSSPASTLVSIGCYGFNATIGESLTTYLEQGLPADNIGSFIGWLVETDTVSAFRSEEPWFDVGAPAPYREAVAWNLDGGAKTADSASSVESVLTAGSFVGERATVERSSLTSTIVLPGATVRNCELRDSIIGPGTTVENRHLANGLLAEPSTE